MCLILIAWQAHPDYPLVVAANRDEFHARPSAMAGRWPDAPGIIGGRDLGAAPRNPPDNSTAPSAGTWLGLRDDGRFAAVTNVREPGLPAGPSSRGVLTRDFLCASDRPTDFAAAIQGEDYSGFNLLLADRTELVYCSNRQSAPQLLPPGIYGLSNHRLDTPWPKLLTARRAFSSALSALPNSTPMFDLLADDVTVDDENLPKTGVSLEWERRLSAIFVQSPDYGTRASSVLWRHANGDVSFEEVSFGPNGQPTAYSVIKTGV